MTPTIDSSSSQSPGIPTLPQIDESDDEARCRTSQNQETLLHKESLDNCLKIFNDNKISKDNVWQMSLIDHFRPLIDKHHKTLSSFQMVGSCLEASSKIYEVRVDSVHADVVRMSSGLIRQRIAENPDESMTQDVSTNQPNQHVEQRLVRKKKRAVSTVTRNKDSINAKLESNAEGDAIFAKLNSAVENKKSTKKLLQYVLPSYNSELKLRMDYKIWKNEEAPINDPNALDVFEEPIYDLPEIDWNPSDSDVLRPQIAGYVISNTPEDDGNMEIVTAIAKPNDESFIDVRFDIDAEVEPIQDEADFVDIEDNDFDSLAEDDQHAIKACRGLQRGAIVINDMRPDSISLDLEYSYRLITDKINRFWAGPSFWKFKNPKGNAIRSSTADKKKKPFKNKIEPIEFEKDANDSMYVSIDAQAASKLIKANIYKRWEAVKMMLPHDYKLNRNRFLLYSLAPGVLLSVAIHGSPKTVESESYTDVGNNVEYAYNVENDNEYYANAHVEDNFTHNEFGDTTVTEIGIEFFGAPEQVDQININFAKTAKVVDMKQLKLCCLSIIHKGCAAKSDLPCKSQTLNEDYIGGSSSFCQIYKELQQKLNVNSNMKEALSVAVAFYSVLHLANENNFRLIKDDENGFLIRQIL